MQEDEGSGGGARGGGGEPSPPKTERLETSRCRAEVAQRAPRLLATRIHGHADLAVARFYIARAQREMLTGKLLRVFHD